MPTCYTDDISRGENVTFEMFANHCLRNFGIYTRFPEEYQNYNKRYEIPDKLYPHDYHKRQLADAQKKYDETIKHHQTIDELNSEYDEYVKETKIQNEKHKSDAALRRERYEAMLEKVCKWIPPTEEHKGIKTFMLQQLNDSIQSDCKPFLSQILTREEWIKQKQDNEPLVDNIKYHLQSYQKDIIDTAESNDFLNKFRESIKGIN